MDNLRPLDIEVCICTKPWSVHSLLLASRREFIPLALPALPSLSLAHILTKLTPCGWCNVVWARAGLSQEGTEGHLYPLARVSPEAAVHWEALMAHWCFSCVPMLLLFCGLKGASYRHIKYTCTHNTIYIKCTAVTGMMPLGSLATQWLL